MTTTKPRGVVMTADEVRRVRAGAKTQLRRVVKPQPIRTSSPWDWKAEPGEVVILDGLPTRLHESRGRNKAASGELSYTRINCPFGKPGDRLFVKEPLELEEEGWVYVAGGDPIVYDASDDATDWHHNRPAMQSRCPATRMPRWASRLALEIVNVRVERVQEISEEDIVAEGATVDVVSRVTGVPWSHMRTLHEAYREWWNFQHGTGAWDRNEWVWVLTFKVVGPLASPTPPKGRER